MERRKVVVLSGAGISAESGISTFRDANGLWKNHAIEEVASPIAWQRDMDLVLEFYNIRRKQLFEVEPNKGHQALVDLETEFEVDIVTQNVDDLHERAGSSKVMHLHGELKKVRSTLDENLVYELKNWELKRGDLCEKGAQLRPHIVWFGEAVPALDEAAKIVREADILIIVGTSMVVYPAASLIDYAPALAKIYYIDPNAHHLAYKKEVQCISEKASIALPTLVKELLSSTH
ncbi:MAG: NAD-dependent protein deacylase [Bacteroidetes bacterium 4572_77]|nr:MAG: NAD-dependent protein deacylase [Bacteroidetes bacterium 4572_77]